MCKTFAGKRYTNSTGKQNWANRSVNQADLIQQYANIVTVLLFCVNPFFWGGGAPHATALLYQTRERERESVSCSMSKNRASASSRVPVDRVLLWFRGVWNP